MSTSNEAEALGYRPVKFTPRVSTTSSTSDSRSTSQKNSLNKSVSLTYGGASPFRQSLASKNSTTDVSGGYNDELHQNLQQEHEKRDTVPGIVSSKELTRNASSRLALANRSSVGGPVTPTAYGTASYLSGGSSRNSSVYRRFSGTNHAEPVTHTRFVQPEKEITLVKQEVKKADFRRKSVHDQAMEAQKELNKQAVLSMISDLTLEKKQSGDGQDDIFEKEDDWS